MRILLYHHHAIDSNILSNFIFFFEVMNSYVCVRLERINNLSEMMLRMYHRCYVGSFLLDLLSSLRTKSTPFSIKNEPES